MKGAARVLDGAPYSLPPEADAGLAEMRTRLRKARTGLRDALKEAERIGLVREMDRAHAYWTVFESNSIEFEGPDLSGTGEAIESAAGQDVIRDLNVNLLPELPNGTSITGYGVDISKGKDKMLTGSARQTVTFEDAAPKIC